MTATVAAEKKPIPLEQLPNECDILQKKVFDLPFDVSVSALVGMSKVLALRVIEKISGFEKRLAELEAFRDMVIQAHEAMQKEQAESATATPAPTPSPPASTPALAVVPSAKASRASKASKPDASNKKDGGAA